MRIVSTILRLKGQKPSHEASNGFDVGQEGGIDPRILALLDHGEIREMAIRLGEFEQREVREIMVPRDRVVAVTRHASLVEFIDRSIDSGYSKLPVYRETLDEITGVAFLKDILKRYGLNIPKDEPVESIARPVLLVPEVKHIFGLLKSFQEKRTTLAVVVDEFGSTVGIVTVHDLMEELFGDLLISQEEEEEKDYVSLPKGGFEVLARISLEELMEETGVVLEKPQDVETLNGLLVHNLGRIPKPGEKIELSGYRFLVLEADPRKAVKVRIEPVSPTQSS